MSDALPQTVPFPPISSRTREEREQQERELAEAPELDRLPPPVFPPGSRAPAPLRSRANHGEQAAAPEVLPDASEMSPDPAETAARAAAPVHTVDKAPGRPQGGFPEEAFILPDEPIRRREPHLSLEHADETMAGEVEDVEVTGIGSGETDYYSPPRPPVSVPPEAYRAADVMEKLARIIRKEGAAALLTDPGDSDFEATLRGFVAGYFARANHPD